MILWKIVDKADQAIVQTTECGFEPTLNDALMRFLSKELTAPEHLMTVIGKRVQQTYGCAANR